MYSITRYYFYLIFVKILIVYNEIKFSQDQDNFGVNLNKEVIDTVTKEEIQNAYILLWAKLLFYTSISLMSIILLYLNPYGDNFILLLLNYILIGISGTFWAFNSAHDACHGTFSRKKWINNLIYYLSFNMQGVSARLWQIRHLASHHLFPNVDGCDADYDHNPLIRYSPNQPIKSYMKYQHIYSVILYSFYLFIWIYAKDFLYLNKKNLANLRDQQYPFWYTIEFILAKLMYLTYILILPIFLLDFTAGEILFAYSIMLMINANIFIHTLISTHFAMETDFPSVNKDGVLPYNYSEHQLMTSLDYYPESKIANFFFGGFNAHAAHHLFPQLPHTIYPRLTPIIKKFASKYNYRYNELTLPKAIKSHFTFLKNMGVRNNY